MEKRILKLINQRYAVLHYGEEERESLARMITRLIKSREASLKRELSGIDKELCASSTHEEEAQRRAFYKEQYPVMYSLIEINQPKPTN